MKNGSSEMKLKILTKILNSHNKKSIKEFKVLKNILKVLSNFHGFNVPLKSILIKNCLLRLYLSNTVLFCSDDVSQKRAGG